MRRWASILAVLLLVAGARAAPAQDTRSVWQLMRLPDGAVVGQAELSRGRMVVRVAAMPEDQTWQLEVLDEAGGVRYAHRFTAQPGGAAILTLAAPELEGPAPAALQVRAVVGDQPGAIVLVGRLRGRR